MEILCYRLPVGGGYCVILVSVRKLRIWRWKFNLKKSSFISHCRIFVKTKWSNARYVPSCVCYLTKYAENSPGMSKYISSLCKLISPECLIHVLVKLVRVGSDNGVSSIRRHTTVLTNTWILLSGQFWNKPEWNLNKDSKLFINKMHL